VLAERGVVLAHPGYRVSNGARGTRPYPLRRGRGSPLTTAQAEGARQLCHEELPLGLALGGRSSSPLVRACSMSSSMSASRRR
jgi:hypothetical protein